MATVFTQTQTAAPCGTIAACSGATMAHTPLAHQATIGGTAGTTEVTPKISVATTGTAFFMFELPAAAANWDGGNYIVRLNVTTAESLITWTGTYVCRVNSSCVSQATVGSLTGQSISLGTTGVKSMTVSGAAQTNPDTDKIYIVLVGDCGADHGQPTVGITPDQDIDTPLAAGSTIGLTAAVSALSTVAGAFGAIRGLTATVSALSALTATQNKIAGLTATVTATSASTASFERERLFTDLSAIATPGPRYRFVAAASTKPLVAAVTGASAVTAALATIRSLVAQSDGTSSVTASMASIRQLSATVTAQSVVTGDLVAVRSLVAQSDGVSATTAQLVVVRSLVSQIDASGVVTASFSKSGVQTPTAVIAATSSVTGALGALRPLTAAITAQATVSSVLGAVRPLSASVTGQSAVTASMVSLRALTAAPAGASATTASMVTIRALTATVTGQSAIAGDFESFVEGAKGTGPFTDLSAIATPGPRYTFSAKSELLLTAGITAQSVVTASLAGIRGLTVDIGAVAAVDALLTGTRRLTAAINASATVTAESPQTLAGRLQITDLSAIATPGPRYTFAAKAPGPESLQATVSGSSTVTARLDSVLPTALLIPKHRELIAVYEV